MQHERYEWWQQHFQLLPGFAYYADSTHSYMSSAGSDSLCGASTHLNRDTRHYNDDDAAGEYLSICRQAAARHNDF